MPAVPASVSGMGWTPIRMESLDDRIRRRAVKINLSLEILRDLEYLLTMSKPLTDDQIMYCLMLHDEIEKLTSLLFRDKG